MQCMAMFFKDKRDQLSSYPDMTSESRNTVNSRKSEHLKVSTSHKREQIYFSTEYSKNREHFFIFCHFHLFLNWENKNNNKKNLKLCLSILIY